MKRNRKAIAYAAFACSLALLSINAYNQQSMAGVAPYANMPVIAPIGERIEKYQEVNESAKGPSIDPQKGYRLQKLGLGLYMITDNAYQSMFMVYEKGVVVVDAPPPIAQNIRRAIAEVTDKPITHLIYSHSQPTISVARKP